MSVTQIFFSPANTLIFARRIAKKNPIQRASCFRRPRRGCGVGPLRPSRAPLRGAHGVGTRMFQKVEEYPSPRGIPAGFVSGRRFDPSPTGVIVKWLGLGFWVNPCHKPGAGTCFPTPVQIPFPLDLYVLARVWWRAVPDSFRGDPSTLFVLEMMDYPHLSPPTLSQGRLERSWRRLQTTEPHLAQARRLLVH